MLHLRQFIIQYNGVGQNTELSMQVIQVIQSHINYQRSFANVADYLLTYLPTLATSKDI